MKVIWHNKKKKSRLFRSVRRAALLTVVAMLFHVTAAHAEMTLRGKRIALVVYAQNEAAESVLRAAQTRMEDVFLENEVEVLDRQQLEQVKDLFATLEDPTAFVTAETFIENAQRVQIDGILALYVSADVRRGLADYYTATSHIDIRFIDEETAEVVALSTEPMGSRGAPPSDALTRNAALINAVQRAVDDVCIDLGFELGFRARPSMVEIKLGSPVDITGRTVAFPQPERDMSLAAWADLASETWRVEEVSATARAPTGGLGAVAGYIIDTDMMRRTRLFGSRVHVIDTNERRSLNVFETSPVERKRRDEPHTKEIQGVAFVGGWQYLVAATGNHLFLWDIERGIKLSELPLTSEPNGLTVIRSNSRTEVVLRTGRGRRTQLWAYPITR